MPGPLDLTGQTVRQTYQRVVQYESGALYDGLGNALPIGSVTIVGEDYLSISVQEITAHAIDLASSNVSGRLPYANIVQVTAQRLIGNPTGSVANISEITLGTNLAFSGSILNASFTETDPVFSAWLSTPPNISIFTNNSGYLTTISGISAGGELSGTYPNPTLVNSAVIGKVLTGLNITGGTIASTDTIVNAFGKLQNQVNSLIGGVIYKGTWDASTNTPSLTDGTGSQGWYYVISTGANRDLGSGTVNYNIGDWVIHNGTIWQKVDNTDVLTSVGTIGATPNANGLTLSGGVLNLEPADGTFGGIVTINSQIFAGEKSFSSLTNFTSGTYGVYMGASSMFSDEEGLYSSASDQVIAAFDYDTNSYYYANGNMLYNSSTLTIEGETKSHNFYTGTAITNGSVFFQDLAAGVGQYNSITAIDGGIEVKDTSNNTIFSVQSDILGFGLAATRASVSNTLLTTTRTYELPNSSGTVDLVENFTQLFLLMGG